MPTYYVNDHNYEGRKYRRGAWYIGYTTGSGDDTHASPCDYGYTRWIKESDITNKKPRGFCNMGGRAWVITTRNKSNDDSDSFLEKSEASEEEKTKLPANVKNMYVGNGYVLWTLDEKGMATSVAFVPDDATELVEDTND